MSEYDQTVRLDHDAKASALEFVFTDTSHKPHNRRGVDHATVQLRVLDRDETQAGGDNTLRLELVETVCSGPTRSVHYATTTLTLLPAAREALFLYLANPGNRKAAIV